MPSKETELFVFDLDGTLAPSKLPIEEDMVATLTKLLAKRKVAVIGGGSFEVYKKQFESMMNSNSPVLKNLSLFPTSGSRYYTYDNGWDEIYRHELSEEDKKKIIEAINRAIESSGVSLPQMTYGERVEDRGTQISFSAIGQEAPESEKAVWDPDQKKRFKIKAILDGLIPEFEIRIGGMTTIDITKKGIDKAFGIRMMQKYLGVSIDKMFYVGDALFKGGNDEAVLTTGIKTHEVKDQKETREWIESVIPLLD